MARGSQRPSLVMKIALDLVAFRVHRSHDRFRRAEGNLVFAGPAAVQNRHAQFAHKILFPIADITSSTASNAVRFTSSITGFTSTISIDTILPLSLTVSIARCASR